jgi:hypothetical protein
MSAHVGDSGSLPTDVSDVCLSFATRPTDVSACLLSFASHGWGKGFLGEHARNSLPVFG